MSTIAAAVLAADRIDNWIRRQVSPGRPVASSTANDDSAISFVDTCVGPPHRSRSNRLSQSKAVLAWDSSVWLSAIGQCLRAQYDALAAPIPPHMAELVEQLETKK